MRLQYQLSNGTWIDCGARSEEFLARCVRFGGLPAEAAVLATLSSGKTVRNDRDDWYSNCRDGEIADAQLAAVRARQAAAEAADSRPILRCRCGNTGRAGSYPFSTLPGSGRCDDCV